MGTEARGECVTGPLIMNPAPLKGSLPTAVWLMKNGLWPVPVHPKEKRPIGNGWALEYPSRERLEHLFARHHRAGVGMALGPESGVVDFEIDDPATAPELELPASLGWSSARGTHKLFLWDRRLAGLPATLHIGGAELRLGGDGKQVFSICPPTVGDDRRRRVWNQVWEIRPLPACLLKQVERPNPSRKLKVVAPTGGNRYTEAALRYEAEAVAKAPEGERNRTLNRSAFVLSRFIITGALSRQAVESVLGEAASDAGLGDREIRSTLKSAIDAGVAKTW